MGDSVILPIMLNLLGVRVLGKVGTALATQSQGTDGGGQTTQPGNSARKALTRTTTYTGDGTADSAQTPFPENVG